MNTDWKNMLVFMGLVALLCGVIFYYIKSEENSESGIDYLDRGTNQVEDNFPNAQGYHWGHMPITFKISGDICNEYLAYRVKQAFKEITNKTNGAVTFEEVLDSFNYSIKPELRKVTILIKSLPNRRVLLSVPNEEIGVFETNNNGEVLVNYTSASKRITFKTYRSYVSPEPQIIKQYERELENGTQIVLDDTLPQEPIENKDSKSNLAEVDYTADIFIKCYPDIPVVYRGYDEVIVTQAVSELTEVYGNTITHSTISFFNIKGEEYFSGGCVNYPNTEIHEILHSLGFQEHSTNPISILNAFDNGCNSFKIDDYIVDKLKNDYKV